MVLYDSVAKQCSIYISLSVSHGTVYCAPVAVGLTKKVTMDHTADMSAYPPEASSFDNMSWYD